MATKNSTDANQGRYVAGGQTEVNEKALEWWERAVYTLDVSDQRFVIDARTEGRPDLIAAATLGDSKLWWVLMQYNAILDPAGECVTGRIIRIPDSNRVQTLLGGGKTGGYDSTREVPLMNITPVV